MHVMDNFTPWRAGRLTICGQRPCKEENGDQRKACRSIMKLLQHHTHLSSHDELIRHQHIWVLGAQVKQRMGVNTIPSSGQMVAEVGALWSVQRPQKQI